MTHSKSAPSAPPKPMRFYTVSQVAQMLSVSPRTVRRWIEDKKLVAHKFGGAVRIAESDLQAFIGTHRND